MIKNITFAFLFTLLGLCAQAQDLNQTINLKAENKTLIQVFDQISKDYDVSFSYLNNELPNNKVDIEFEGISLDHALTNLLEGFQLQHVTHSGQIIIKKKNAVKKDPQPDPVPFETPGEEAEIQLISPEETSSVSVNEAEEDSTILEETVQEPIVAVDSAIVQPDSVDAGSIADESINSTSFPKDDNFQRSSAGSSILVTIIDGKEGVNHSDTVEVTDDLERRIAHFGIFYPFSTNGYHARNYINNISMHLIAGYSGGLDGFEFSGIANIVDGSAKGFQLGGVLNLTKESFTGAQISGVTNITWYDFRGLQLAGIANISHDRNLGFQLAGVANVSKGRESGFQLSGIANVTYGKSRFGQVAGIVNSAWEVEGIQAAGIVNISSNQYGLQISPFLNKAGNISGGQVSGFINRAGEVKGVQIAPFLNVAKKVHGAQIGLINISDEMHGTPIGLFCLAKRNGYFDFEMFYSDDFQANAAIKIGAAHFHNIFAFSYETDYKNRWAYGYGFGSQWGKGGVRLNTDVVTYYVMEQEFPNGAFRDFELNLLSRFRFLPSLHVGDFGVFAGPTVNVMLSDHYDEENGLYGSDITPTPLYENVDSFGRSLKFWIGYNVGVRF
ncbi:MAG: hypothetical protein RIC35_12210 [Marinoscillum sp.]